MNTFKSQYNKWVKTNSLNWEDKNYVTYNLCLIAAIVISILEYISNKNTHFYITTYQNKILLSICL